MKICSIDDCPKTVMARGWCRMHYGRWSIHGTPLKGGKGYKHKVQHTADGLRICKGCAEPKPFTEFHKDGNAPDGYRAQCKPCRNTYMSGYYDANRESRMEYEQDRRTNKAEHMRALDMARYERHRDKRIALASDGVRTRRARLQNTEVDAKVTVKNLRDIHGDSCCYCGVEMDFNRGVRGEGIAPNRATLEHVLPLSRGGTHTFDNTALACHRCNVRKNNKTVDEWTGNGNIAHWNRDLEGCEEAAS